MKQMIQKFVGKHGYTLKSYWLSLLVFPPAAHYIACKMPGWSLFQRVLANLVPIGMFVLMTFIGIPIIRMGYKLVMSLFTG